MSLPDLKEEPEIVQIESKKIDNNDVSDKHIYIQLPDTIMEIQDYTSKKISTLWNFMKPRVVSCIHKIDAVPKEEYKTIIHSVMNINLEQQKVYSTYSLDNDL